MNFSKSSEDIVKIGFVWSLFILIAAFSLTTTIQYTDADLWYHLAGGRSFFETGMPANPFDRSYLDHGRGFITYFWGFQAISYGFWLALGYTGLIVLKSALVVTTTGLIAGVLLGGRPVRESTVLPLIILALVAFVLSTRGITVRPHYFSYFFIAAFLYVLLVRIKWAPVLPFLTLCWINIHGVEWVVGALICGAFIVQQLVFFYTTTNQRDLTPCIWVLLCLPVLLINPFTYNVLLTPFLSRPEIFLFIEELAPFSVPTGIDFGDGLTARQPVFILLLFYFASLFAIRGEDLRRYIMVLLLAIGGLALLAQGERFVLEWCLLSTPLFASGARTLRIELTSYWSGWSGVLAILLSLIGYTFMQTNLASLDRYPFDENSFPKGTTDFIERVTDLPGGSDITYTVPPTFAGYIEWRLPNVRVHMDLQLPPFDDLDYFEWRTSQLSAFGLNQLVQKYEPDFIGVSKENLAFKQLAASQPQYVPVFFDRRLVLYINRRRHPDIADHHRLRHIDPFNPDRVQIGHIEDAISELSRMSEITPNLPSVNATLIGLLIEVRRLNEAYDLLIPLKSRYPTNESLLFFSARIAQLKGDYESAINDYEKLMETGHNVRKVGGLLGESYFLNNDPEAAYHAFSKSINPYKDKHQNFTHYYLYAFSSLIVGDIDKADRLLRIFDMINDGRDPKLSAQVETLKELVRADLAKSQVSL